MKLIDADALKEDMINLNVVMGISEYDELDKWIDSAPTVPQWTKIDSPEDLPDTSKWVFAVTDTWHTYIMRHNHNDEWENNVNGQVWRGDIVAWMPLPNRQRKVSEMTVKEIVKQYLEQNGYTGLYNGDIECGCGLDDFAPCGDMSEHCKAGYLNECTTCVKRKDCDVKYCEYGEIFRDVKCWVMESGHCEHTAEYCKYKHHSETMSQLPSCND